MVGDPPRRRRRRSGCPIWGLSRIPRSQPSSAACRIAFADAPCFLLCKVPGAPLFAIDPSQKIGGSGPSRVRDVGIYS